MHHVSPTSPSRRARRRGAPALVLATALVVGLAGCGSDGGSSGDQASGDATTTTAAPDASSGSGSVDLKVADSDLGEILVDGEGRTLYAFTPDSATASTCNDGCDTTWPPLTTTGTPKADGVEEEYLGTIEREDGSTQISVEGHPLYTYAADAKPGDTSGQGVGGSWYVVDAEGKLVKGSGADSGSDSSSGGDGGY